MNRITLTIDMDIFYQWCREHQRNIIMASNKDELNDVEIRLVQKELTRIKNVKDFLETVAVNDENKRTLMQKVKWMNRDEKTVAQKTLMRYVEPIVNQPLPEMPFDKY